MTDTDRTNIYSYRGTDFTGDLHDYLTAQGLDIRLVQVIDGVIYISDETTLCSVPQAAQWWQIARRMRA